MVDDLAHHLGLERASVAQHPVVAITRQRAAFAVLLVDHVADHRAAVREAWRWYVGGLFHALDAEDLERPASRRRFRVERLGAESEPLRQIREGAHQDVVEEAAEDPVAQAHGLRGQPHVLHVRSWGIGLHLEQELLDLADRHRELELAFADPLVDAGRLLGCIVEEVQVPDIEQVEQDAEVEPADVGDGDEPRGARAIDIELVGPEQRRVRSTRYAQGPVHIGTAITHLAHPLAVPAEHLGVVRLALDLDHLRALEARVVNEGALIFDDEEIVRHRVARRRRGAPGDERQLVEAAVDRDVPVGHAVRAERRPGDERFLDLGQRQHRVRGLEGKRPLLLHQRASAGRASDLCLA